MVKKFNIRAKVLLLLVLPICLILEQFFHGVKNTSSYSVRQNPIGIEFFLDPVTSKRDNFGLLFEKILLDAHKKRGNFLEIGGGSGKFFDHNMATFGHLVKNYIIIEPYKLLSESKEPLPAFAEKVGKWEANTTSTTNIIVHHDFSTSSDLIKSFPDNFFDFIYIDGDHSYKGAKSDLTNYYSKVRRGGVLAGHDYCCNRKEFENTIHAPWCGKYIYPDSTSDKKKDGKDKTAFCEIFIGAEEFAKDKNFYWLYTLEDRGNGNSAGSNNPSYFTIKL